MLKLGRRLFASIFLSVMAVSLLSLLPALMEQGAKREDVPAFRSGSAMTLTESNLVDVLSKRPSSLQLKRVEWGEGTLTLFVSSPQEKEPLHRALVTLLRYLLVDTSNVDRLTLEVHGLSENFSVKAKRGDLVRDPGMKRANDENASLYLQKMFQVTNLGEG
ncbi:hypothetical protein [Marininema halotolerans]|uniref:Uncharacterized protein n=1 Tax=Marininema halotolerans TaxID=1155944 RepID=A0A1I6TYM5_9BACL|nr:hypothetical protein [Marininema halotolerans]SFS94301.1 hypothetical protein SAMN05444972_11224 [Marininema halotolerans]